MSVKFYVNSFSFPRGWFYYFSASYSFCLSLIIKLLYHVYPKFCFVVLSQTEVICFQRLLYLHIFFSKKNSNFIDRMFEIVCLRIFPNELTVLFFHSREFVFVLFQYFYLKSCYPVLWFNAYAQWVKNLLVGGLIIIVLPSKKAKKSAWEFIINNSIFKYTLHLVNNIRRQLTTSLKFFVSKTKQNAKCIVLIQDTTQLSPDCECFQLGKHYWSVTANGPNNFTGAATECGNNGKKTGQIRLLWSQLAFSGFQFFCISLVPLQRSSVKTCQSRSYSEWSFGRRKTI